MAKILTGVDSMYSSACKA